VIVVHHLGDIEQTGFEFNPPRAATITDAYTVE
jgi:hypothetical protein